MQHWWWITSWEWNYSSLAFSSV